MSGGSVKGSKKRGSPFDDTEELLLLNIWASPETQAKFKKYNKHSIVYQFISREHNKSGSYCRTAAEVSTKIKNCKAKYNQCKPKSGDPPPAWASYNIVHQVLGQKDSCTLKNLDDSLNCADSVELDRLSWLQDEEITSDNESHQICTEHNSDSEASNSELSQNNNKKRFQKIKRPPRRVQSKESVLIETLLEDRKKEEEWYKKIEDRDARAEEREKALTNNLNQFLNVASVWMQCLLVEKGVSLPNMNNNLTNFNSVDAASSRNSSVPTPSSTRTSGAYNNSLVDKSQNIYSVDESISNNSTFSPAPMKPQRSVIRTKSDENCDKKVQKMKAVNSKFKPKVISNISLKRKYKIDDIKKNLFNTKPVGYKEKADKCIDKENKSDFLQILEEESSDSDSQTSNISGHGKHFRLNANNYSNREKSIFKTLH